MDPMIMRLLDEVSQMISENDQTTLDQGLGSPQMDYIW